jgi:Na+(H+)/acetate symporter ActP
VKISDEQKAVIKEVAQKASERLVADVKQAELKSFKRPLVVLVLVIAAVGILRDPMSLVIGLLAAVGFALALSTSKEQVGRFVSSPKEEAKKIGDVEEKKKE